MQHTILHLFTRNAYFSVKSTKQNHTTKEDKNYNFCHLGNDVNISLETIVLPVKAFNDYSGFSPFMKADSI